MRKLSFEPLHLLRLRRDNLIDELQQTLGNGVEGYIEHLVTQSPKAKEAEKELQKRLEFQEQRRPWEAPNLLVAAIAQVCREVGEAENHELESLLVSVNRYENPS